MKLTIALAFAVLAACTPFPEFTDDDLMPFRSAIQPDGSRTWTFVLTPTNKSYFPDKSGEQLLAAQMGSNLFCENGYRIDGVEVVDETSIYNGVCL